MRDPFAFWSVLGYGLFWPLFALTLLTILVGLGTYLVFSFWQDSRDANDQLRNH